MEFVYVVKRYDLFDLAFPHGFHGGGEGEDSLSTYLERIRGKGFFMERRACETDSRFKQIIPYNIIAHEDRVLLLRRSAGQGEARLHHKFSIGVGGHINPVDAEEGRDKVLERGCLREISEEIRIDEPFEPRPVGVINDESNPVGSVHFGVVFLVRLAEGRVRVRETSMMTAEFRAAEEIRRMAAEKQEAFESWSSLTVKAFHHLGL